MSDAGFQGSAESQVSRPRSVVRGQLLHSCAGVNSDKKWISIDPSTTAPGSQFGQLPKDDGGLGGVKTPPVRCKDLPAFLTPRGKWARIRGMIFATHFLLYSRDPAADRAFFRDVLELSHVDSGEGWLIFALPPAEMGIHPAEENLTRSHADQQLATGTLYLVCDDLSETLAGLAAKGVAHSQLREAEWGVATSIPLPGGSSLGIYEPRHALAVKRG